MSEEPRELTASDWAILSPADSAAEVRRRHEANRSAWNEGAARYTERLDEALAALRSGRSHIHPVERANLGDLRSWCSTAIHLQCASGRDTLSLWLEGASREIGVDISDVHIANARALTEALGAPAQWYRCDVLDTPHELDGTADLVYTGRGALCWIHDIDGWAAVVARLLKPGGLVHVLDDHPFTWFFRQDREHLELEPGVDYLSTAGASQGWPASYIGDLAVPVEEQTVKHERLWPLSAVVMALIQAGLTVEYLGEHRDGYWDVFPRLDPLERERIPLTFSIMARK